MVEDGTKTGHCKVASIARFLNCSLINGRTKLCAIDGRFAVNADWITENANAVTLLINTLTAGSENSATRQGHCPDGDFQVSNVECI